MMTRRKYFEPIGVVNGLLPRPVHPLLGWPADRMVSIPGSISEILFIDPSDHDNPAIVGSIAGKHYKLDTLAIGMNLPLLKVEVIPRELLSTAKSPAFITQAEAASWLLTLAKPDNSHILSQHPLTDFFPLGAAARRMCPRYFAPTSILDPLQSYLTPTVDAQTSIIPLRFTYWPLL